MEKVIKELINYLISHSEIKTCSFCEYQVNNRSMCNTCNKNLRSNFKPDVATELIYRYRAEDIINIVNDNIK